MSTIWHQITCFRSRDLTRRPTTLSVFDSHHLPGDCRHTSTRLQQLLKLVLMAWSVLTGRIIRRPRAWCWHVGLSRSQCLNSGSCMQIAVEPFSTLCSMMWIYSDWFRTRKRMRQVPSIECAVLILLTYKLLLEGTHVRGQCWLYVGLDLPLECRHYAQRLIETLSITEHAVAAAVRSASTLKHRSPPHLSTAIFSFRSHPIIRIFAKSVSFRISVEFNGQLMIDVEVWVTAEVDNHSKKYCTDVGRWTQQLAVMTNCAILWLYNPDHWADIGDFLIKFKIKTLWK